MVALPDAIASLSLPELVIRDLHRHVQVALAPGQPRLPAEVIGPRPRARAVDDLVRRTVHHRVGNGAPIRKVAVHREGGIGLEGNAEGLLAQPWRLAGCEHQEHNGCPHG